MSRYGYLGFSRRFSPGEGGECRVDIPPAVVGWSLCGVTMIVPSGKDEVDVDLSGIYIARPGKSDVRPVMLYTTPLRALVAVQWWQADPLVLEFVRTVGVHLTQPCPSVVIPFDTVYPAEAGGFVAIEVGATLGDWTGRGPWAAGAVIVREPVR